MDEKPILSEKEIHRIFEAPKAKPGFFRILKKIIFEIIIIGAIFIVSFVIVNFPAVYNNLKYWWKVDVKNQTTVDPSIKPPTEPVSNESNIYIPKIGVEAPIIWDIQYSQIRPQLANGAVHYEATAHPNEVGNVFIVGHSSDYVWAKGQYKQIFSLLYKLKPGDEIYITYLGKKYTYQVLISKVVKPTATEIMNPTVEPTLTLMTCYPVGTTRSRLVVQSKLISPTLAEKQLSVPKSYNLPSFR